RSERTKLFSSGFMPAIAKSRRRHPPAAFLQSRLVWEIFDSFPARLMPMRARPVIPRLTPEGTRFNLRRQQDRCKRSAFLERTRIARTPIQQDLFKGTWQ